MNMQSNWLIGILVFQAWSIPIMTLDTQKKKPLWRIVNLQKDQFEIEVF